MGIRDAFFRPRADAADREAFAFLEAYVDSFIKWDILHYLYYHPHAVSTAEVVAKAMNREVDQVALALHELAEAGVLVENRLGDVLVYAFSADERIGSGLKAFIEAATRDDFRYRAIFHLVRGPRWQE